MINVRIAITNNYIKKFNVSGHATSSSSDTDGKLVCSAVSSATIMAANTISEIICDEADINCEENAITITLNNPNDCTQAILKGLQLHLTSLQEQYNKRLYVEVLYND